jgi:cystathionine gamma-synthase
LRGLRTLEVRYRKHEENAMAVVERLESHPAVARVYYPGLEDHPGHAIAARQQHSFGAMISFELEGGAAHVPLFLESLQLFTLAESLGGVESLVAHPSTMTHAAMSEAEQRAAGIGPGLLRLSIGIEHPDDLLHDLAQALETVSA